MSARNIGINNVPTLTSIIIDIMDQSKCHIPDLGMQGVFNEPFDQMVVGVKVNQMQCCFC